MQQETKAEDSNVNTVSAADGSTVRNTNKQRTVQIGSIHIGAKGLLGGVALLLSLTGVGTAAVIVVPGSHPTPTRVPPARTAATSQVIGTWRHGGGDVSNGPLVVHEDPTILMIAANGTFSLTSAISTNFGGGPTQLGQGPQSRCTGSIATADDHFTVDPTGGGAACENLTATLSTDRRTLTLVDQSGQSMSFSRED